MTKSCFQQKPELHKAKTKWNCSAKTLHCKHQHKEWNLTQSVEAQAMFIKCFWNILWWVIEVVNYIKSTEHKSDSFQTPVWLPPHYNSTQASLSFPSIWLINSTLWTSVTCMTQFISCVSHENIKLLSVSIAYSLHTSSCLISFADTRCLWKPAATRLLNPYGAAPHWSSLPSPCAAPLVWWSTDNSTNGNYYIIPRLHMGRVVRHGSSINHKYISCSRKNCIENSKLIINIIIHYKKIYNK